MKAWDYCDYCEVLTVLIVNVIHVDCSSFGQQEMQFWFHKCKQKHRLFTFIKKKNHAFTKKETLNDSKVSSNNFLEVLCFSGSSTHGLIMSVAPLPSKEMMAGMVESKAMVFREKTTTFSIKFLSFFIHYNDNKTFFFFFFNSVIPGFPSLIMPLTLKWNLQYIPHS